MSITVKIRYKKKTQENRKMKNIEIKRVSTKEENVSLRTISYDLYVNGKYENTYNDINDVLDARDKYLKKL